MELLTDHFDVKSRQGVWKLDVYGDTHLGTVAVDEERLKRDIADTHDKGHYWCHVGDIVDGIVPGDRRFSDSYKKMLTPWAKEAYFDNNLIEAQWNYFEELFTPIKDKGLFALSGDGKHNRTENIADCFKNSRERLGIRGGFVSCFYTPVFTRSIGTARKAINMVFHHGWFAGRTNSNKVIQLEKALNQFHQAWIFVCGHGHSKVPIRVDSLAVEEKSVKEHVRRAAMTGSYLKTYKYGATNYGEVKGYPPVALGKITLVVQPFHGKPEERITFENI